MAGTSKRRNRWLELIAAYKVFQALLLTSVGVGALKLLHHDIADVLTNLAQALHQDPEGKLVNFLLDKSEFVDDRLLKRISIYVFCYAALSMVEGVGLFLEKVWAEYLTVMLTASFLPLEIIEVFHRITWIRVGVFVANLAVLVYLVDHLMNKRAESSD